MGAGEVCGEVTLGFADAETPRPGWGWFARAAGLPMLGEVCCWFAKPNWRLLGRLAGPPLGM